MKQVIVVRKDLNMSPGKAAAQVAHASVSAYAESVSDNPDRAKYWLEHSQTKIIVMVNSEEELLELSRELACTSIPYYLVKDEGRTELKGSNYTTIGIGPASSESIDKYTKQLKLYR